MSSSGVSSKGNLSPSRNSVSTRRSDAGFDASLTLLLLLGARAHTSFFQASAAVTSASTSSARAMVTPWDDSTSERARADDSGRESEASQEDEVKRGGGTETLTTAASLVASFDDAPAALALASLALRVVATAERSMSSSAAAARADENSYNRLSMSRGDRCKHCIADEDEDALEAAVSATAPSLPPLCDPAAAAKTKTVVALLPAAPLPCDGCLTEYSVSTRSLATTRPGGRRSNPSNTSLMSASVKVTAAPALPPATEDDEDGSLSSASSSSSSSSSERIAALALAWTSALTAASALLLSSGRPLPLPLLPEPSRALPLPPPAEPAVASMSLSLPRPLDDGECRSSEELAPGRDEVDNEDEDPPDPRDAPRPPEPPLPLDDELPARPLVLPLSPKASLMLPRTDKMACARLNKLFIYRQTDRREDRRTS